MPQYDDSQRIQSRRHRRQEASHCRNSCSHSRSRSRSEKSDERKNRSRTPSPIGTTRFENQRDGRPINFFGKNFLPNRVILKPGESTQEARERYRREHSPIRKFWPSSPVNLNEDTDTESTCSIIESNSDNSSVASSCSSSSLRQKGKKSSKNRSSSRKKLDYSQSRRHSKIDNNCAKINKYKEKQTKKAGEHIKKHMEKKDSESNRADKNDDDIDADSSENKYSSLKRLNEENLKTFSAKMPSNWSETKDAERLNQITDSSLSKSAALGNKRGAFLTEEMVGPALPQVNAAGSMTIDPRAYGHALLTGEGTAMAAFLQDGKRIPRRGEIGLRGDEIEKFETVGFVMSGSRHHRMNAVRLRKENQVISAEERRKLLLLHAEEKTKRETAIMSDFKELVAKKIRQLEK